MAGFGDLMSPAAPGSQEPEAGSWSDLVKDPVARSALLGFGMQMMTGGWGNGTQQLAAGLGAGATSAAGTSEALQKQLEAEDKAAMAEANQSANRENAVKVAKIGADSRAEVAGIRTAAMLERTQLIQGAKTPDEMRFYSSAYDRAYSEGKKNQIIDRKTDDQVRDEAVATAQRKLVEMRAARGQIPPDTGATSQNGAVTGTGTGQGQTGTAVKGQNSAAQIAPGEKGVIAAMQNPDVQRLLSTPEGQEELKKRNPQAAAVLIERWRKANEAYSGANEMLKRSRTGQ